MNLWVIIVVIAVVAMVLGLVDLQHELLGS